MNMVFARSMVLRHMIVAVFYGVLGTTARRVFLGTSVVHTIVGGVRMLARAEGYTIELIKGIYRIVYNFSPMSVEEYGIPMNGSSFPVWGELGGILNSTKPYLDSVPDPVWSVLTWIGEFLTPVVVVGSLLLSAVILIGYLVAIGPMIVSFVGIVFVFYRDDIGTILLDIANPSTTVGSAVIDSSDIVARVMFQSMFIQSVFYSFVGPLFFHWVLKRLGFFKRIPGVLHG